MKDKKVLFISSEVMPYMPKSDVSFMTFETAKTLHRKGVQTRIFMPRFGVVNERRHQLHEVIRLSGVNLIIDDVDMLLIIKVASVQKERMQVYFIDNDEYFQRKAVFTDEDNILFKDNDERTIFFTKGVMETVKKLNWAPDIIYLHGWITSLVPLYLKEYFNDDALFKDSKIVTSLYDDSFEGSLGPNLTKKIGFDGIPKEKMKLIESPSFLNLQKLAVERSDLVIEASKNLSDEIKNFTKEQGKSVLKFYPEEEEDIEASYLDFFLEKII